MIEHGLPIEVYHALPSLSNSGLRDFAQSPLHFHAKHLNAMRPPAEAKEGQLEGLLAHCAILEPAELERRYVAGPVDDKRLKSWRDWSDAHRGDPRVQVKPAQLAVAQAQSLSVRTLPEVARLLSKGHAEVSAFWRDKATGVECRCRPDWIYPVDEGPLRGVVLVDVKTCACASPVDFAMQVARKAYHCQAAWYTDGYAQAAEVEVLAFVFVAVEVAWPYASCAVMLDEEAIERGRKENAALLPRFAECLRTGDWPGYSDGIEVVPLPRWLAATPVEAAL